MPPVPLVAVTITSADAGLLVAIVVLLVLALVLAAAETALTRVTRPRADALAEEQRRGGEALVELVAHPEQYVTTVVFLLLGCQLVQATLVGILADRLFGIVGMVVAIAIDVGVVFVLAETAPKTWAVLNAERVSLAVARPVRAVARFAPVRLATGGLIAVSNLAVPGSGLKQGPFVSSEEELLAVAELGVEEGVIEEDDRALIESIIEFGDTIVREVMIPRPDMVTVPAHFRVGDVMEIFLLNGYSRLPVCGEEGLDDVVGLAYAKDLMGAERDGMQDAPVGDLVRPARFVPETKRVPDMLREMQRDKFHMAIAVDEYGVTAGLVTLEDIIEELVGEIVDEFDVDDPIVEPLPGGGIRVHGRTPLDQVNDLLRARLPEGDWDTIGGLVYDQLGHVPVEGETVRVAGWHLTAQRIQGRRIGRVSITPDHTPGRPPDAATDSDTDAGTRPGRPAADGPGGPTPEPDEPGGPTPGAKAPGGDPPTAGPPGRRPGTNGTSGARPPPASHATGTDIAARRDVRARARSGGDHGQVGGAEALPFGLLVFVVGALLVASAWAVIDAKLAVDAAARQATRHFVEADVDEPAGAAGAEEAAVAAGLAALDAHGRDPARATVGLSVLDATGRQAGFTRCARVTFTATYEVPALTIPWIGGFGDGIGVTSSHSELVDPFRSGVPGSAQSCDG